LFYNQQKLADWMDRITTSRF